MTKHIPTDIDKMTRKELAELCKIQFDENQKVAMDLVTSYGENQTLLEQIEQLQRELPPREQGCNRYGLDMSYFRNVINRELNRNLADFKPDELARVFARLSRAADNAVMFEPEFASKFAIEQQIKALENLHKKQVFELADQIQLEREIEQLRKQLKGE